MGFLVAVVLGMFVLAILVAMSGEVRDAKEKRERTEKLQVTPEEKQKAELMRQTEFFKKIEKIIVNGHRRDVLENFGELSVGATEISGGYIGDYPSRIKFKELGYKDLSEEEQRILLVALSQMEGYSYEIKDKSKPGEVLVFARAVADRSFWARKSTEEWEKEKSEEQSRLKGIY